jgi:hypothetical protein
MSAFYEEVLMTLQRSTFSFFYPEFIQLMFNCKIHMMIHWGDISDLQIVRKIEPFELEPCIESQVQAFKLCGGFFKIFS